MYSIPPAFRPQSLRLARQERRSPDITVYSLAQPKRYRGKAGDDISFALMGAIPRWSSYKEGGRGFSVQVYGCSGRCPGRAGYTYRKEGLSQKADLVIY